MITYIVTVRNDPVDGDESADRIKDLICEYAPDGPSRVNVDVTQLVENHAPLDVRSSDIKDVA